MSNHTDHRALYGEQPNWDLQREKQERIAENRRKKQERREMRRRKRRSW